jgi:hypothetical protein
LVPFQDPNYTQIPNDLLGGLLGGRAIDKGYMSEMGLSELKVVLAICRLTFGYHQQERRASLTLLQKLTGLSRQGVLDGAEAAERRNLIAREQDGGVTLWRVLVNTVDQSDKVVNGVDRLVNGVDQSGQQSRPPLRKKLRKKDQKEKTATPLTAERPQEKPTKPTQPPVQEPLPEQEYVEPGKEFDDGKSGRSALAEFIGQEMHIPCSNTNLTNLSLPYTEHTTRGKIRHPSPDELWMTNEFFRDYVAQRVEYFKDGSGTPAARRNRLVNLICNYKSEPFGWFAQEKEYKGFTGKWKDV